MSPNMMLACTRPLQFQQGPFFMPLTLSPKRRGTVRCGLFSLAPLGRGPGESTVSSRSTPRALAQDTLRQSCCGLPGRGIPPAIR
ncbi:hypothetical protein AM410_16665 [Enterobacter cloacae complex sp. FDA-CDC-AR_0164]|nr:hypothetical protein AM410_16665 [Enterobacter cloacae complex sp. FDA-CDC-AR_0164]